MKQKQKDILNSTYRCACMDYVCAFAKKQGLEFEYFANELTCDFVAFGDYYFSLADIILDIQSDQPKGKIIDWQNDGIGYHMAGGTENINYSSYCMGLRFEDLTPEKNNL